MFKPEDIDEPFGVGDLEIDGVEYQVPYLKCGFTNGEIILHWGNSTLRSFYFNPEMNHVEYRDDEKRLKGVRMAQEIMDLMQVYGWPMRTDPLVDPQTTEWFVQLQLHDLDRELEDFGGE